jgi:hypothetical protein
MEAVHQRELQHLAIGRGDGGQSTRHQPAPLLVLARVARHQATGQLVVEGGLAATMLAAQVIVGDVASHAVDERRQPVRIPQLPLAQRQDRRHECVLGQVGDGVGLPQPGAEHGPHPRREVRGEGRLGGRVARRDGSDPADDIRSLVVARHGWRHCSRPSCLARPAKVAPCGARLTDRRCGCCSSASP